MQKGTFNFMSIPIFIGIGGLVAVLLGLANDNQEVVFRGASAIIIAVFLAMIILTLNLVL